MGWTDERIEFLKAHWANGESATHIARQLGGVTRNAVLGKIHRMGLAERHAASKPAKVARVVKPPRAIVPFKEEAPGSATTLTLGAYQCKWPIGDPQADDFTFCGARTDDVYCTTVLDEDGRSHRDRAHTPSKTTADGIYRQIRRYV